GGGREGSGVAAGTRPATWIFTPGLYRKPGPRSIVNRSSHGQFNANAACRGNHEYIDREAGFWFVVTTPYGEQGFAHQAGRKMAWPIWTTARTPSRRSSPMTRN